MDTPTSTDDSAHPADDATLRPSPLLVAWFGVLLAVAIYLWCTLTESFIADDSYFYVVIARNIALRGRQTFSNVFPTNGFHPLWGYVLAAYTWVVNVVAPAAVNYVTYAVPLAIAMLAATAVQSWRLARAMRLDPLVITALLVGYVVSLGMLYSEGPLFQLLLVSLLVMMARDPAVAATRPVAFGMLTAAIVLVRLDSIFFVGFVYLYYLWKLRLAPRFVAAGVLCGLVVGGYVLSNIVFFGGMMPISGWLKGNFPHPYIRGFVSCPFPRLQLATIGGYSLLLGWMPLGIGFVTLVVCRSIERIQRDLLLLLWAGTTVQGVYIAMFTRSHTLWPWYYVLPVTLLAISLAILSEWWRAYYARAAVLAAISLAIVVSMLEKTSVVPSPAFPAIAYLEKSGIHGKTVMISDWPGAVAFYTDNNVVAADMLTSNRFDFDKMRASSNALDYLVAECKRLEKPIEHFLMVGSNWLEWNEKAEEITYFDPRRFPVLVPIGELKTKSTPEGEVRTADGIPVWFGPTHNSHDATNIRLEEAVPASDG